MEAFFKKIGDIFLDQAGGVDEKRVLGIVLFIIAIVYLFTHPAGSETWVTVGGLLTFGTGLLGIAVGGDQGRLGDLPTITRPTGSPPPGATNPQ